MKQNGIFKKIVATVLLVCIMFTFTGCAAFLRGTYTSKDSLVEQSFTFEKDNKVKVSAFGINVEGEYRIKDGEITITYRLMDLSYDWSKSFKKEGKSIFIDGTEFVKEK